VTPQELKKFNKLTIGQIEEAIGKGEEEIEEMQQRFGDESVYKDGRKVAELQTQLAAKKAERDLLYRAYEWRTENR
jgi:hypothetical protein